MKVTLISHYFNSKYIGGVGNYSELIYKGLQNKNINLKKLSKEDSLIKKPLPFSYYYYYQFDLKRLLNQQQYKDSDIFHALTVNECLHIPKNKSVVSILDFIPFNEKNETIVKRIFAKSYDKCIKSAIKCERIITINSDVKMNLNQKYGAELDKIEVIPPPIDSKFYPIKKESDELVIGTLSVLSKRKRVDILIKSFLEANVENSKLLIGGNGPELENLKKLANNDERIKFLGYIPNEKMNKFYNSLDAFAFPTELEGYGMPIVEAMACGKPVITLEDGEIPSNIKDRTIVTTEEDFSDLLINQDFKCDIKSNIEFYKEHSIEKISTKLMKVYENI